VTTTVEPPTSTARPGGAARRPRSAGAWCAPITGFRAIAAILVVAGHTFMSGHTYPFTAIIHVIGVVVPTFFVISAYALYRPFLLADVDREEVPSAKGFWWKRFLRVYPLYAFALTLYLVLLPGVRPHGGGTFNYIELFAFLQVYDHHLSAFSGIPAAWFLCDEVAFYLLVPILAFVAREIARRGRVQNPSPKRRLQGHVILGVTMIVVGQVSRIILRLHIGVTAVALPVCNADFYGFGILLAAASVGERRGMRLPDAAEWLRRRRWMALAGLLVGGVAMAFVAKHPGESFSASEDISRYLLYTVMVVPFMTVLVLGDQEGGWVGRLGSNRWSKLAVLSLHVYLWHQLMLAGFDKYVTQLAPAHKIGPLPLGPQFTKGVIIVVLAVVGTVAWSALWRPMLDLPYRRWSKLLPRPADVAPLPTWARPLGIGLIIALLAGGAATALHFGGSPLAVRGGVEQLSITGTHPRDEIVIRRNGHVVARGTTDDQGAFVQRRLRAATYEVEQRREGQRVIQRSVRVRRVGEHPDAGFYQRQHLHAGLNMIEAADGTRLAAFITLPGPESKGPYPTVVEYSAYQIGDGGRTGQARKDNPNVTQPATAVARALGYATVAVNVPGTGCSGGSFDLFGPAQAAAGYDVVQAAAAQPWAKGGKVAMVGFSYGGLAAMQVAGTRPPSLSAVAALSVFGDAWQGLHPGGLNNAGFPVGWLRDLQADAEPSGAEWIQKRIAAGDHACLANQVLHGQQAPMHDTYLGEVPDDGRFADRSPAVWAHDIRVPVLVSSQFQDTTLGADLAEHLHDFSHAPVVKMVLSNGTHGDGIAPQVLVRMNDFLGLYAAGVVPSPLDTNALLRRTRPDVKDPNDLPPGPPAPVRLREGEDLSAARRAYEASPPVEVLWESGAGDHPEAAAARWSTTATTWPPPGTRATSWLLRPGGRLEPGDAVGGTGEGATPAAQFTTDPNIGTIPYSTEGSDLVHNVFKGWDQPDPDHYSSWLSDPVAADTPLTGTASVDLWVRTDKRDADLQVLLLDVRDGKETLVQTGWLRASYRKLKADSTDLWPDTDFSPKAQHDLVPHQWTKVRIRLSSFAHVLRAGSRVRLLVGTPGANQVQWSFGPPPDGAATVDVGQGGARSSALVLPVSSVSIEPGAAACGDLRGQPCRPYEPFANTQVPS
jgi:predicted acyl esterase/peptidoglycan/LPS O-acetylase OafA/YrhL